MLCPVIPRCPVVAVGPDVVITTLLLIRRALLGVGGAAVYEAHTLLGALPPPPEVCTAAGPLIPSVSLMGAGGEPLLDWGT